MEMSNTTYSEENGDEETHIHHQVLQMAKAIELLQRDSEAYQCETTKVDRLRPPSIRTDAHCCSAHTSAKDFEYSRDKRSREWGRLFQSHACQEHEEEIAMLHKLLEEERAALVSVLRERDELRLDLEEAKELITQFQLSRSFSSKWKPRPHTSPMHEYYDRGATPCSHDSTTPRVLSPTHSSPSNRTPSHPISPQERFDQSSPYENYDNAPVFWRRQYREAVRLRRTLLTTSPRRSVQHYDVQDGLKKPTLDIFSSPDYQRKPKTEADGIPHARYIGLNSRQQELIKQHYYLLS